MKTINPTEIKKISKAIFEGRVVAFPSDTSYGLACNPSNKTALKNVYLIKQMPFDKKVSCIFKDLDQVKRWATLTLWQEKILKVNLPGLFTFLLTPNERYPLGGDSIGVRIPNFKFTQMLANELDFPFTSTSANISGQKDLYDSKEVSRLFEKEKFQPDIVVDAGVLPFNPPSTIADLREDKFIIIRQGSRSVNLPN